MAIAESVRLPSGMVKPKGFLAHNVPDLITKEIGVIRDANGNRKIRLSSNWLPLVGFETGVRHSVNPIGHHQGIKLETDADGSQKVYYREYKRRKNNPLESIIEIGSKSMLDQCIPSYTERVHIVMKSGEIDIRPLPNHTFSIRKGLRDSASPFAALVAMTSGIDAACLVDCGFSIDGLVEWRPQEARNKSDLTETGALNALANVSTRYLINEDISTIDWAMVKRIAEAGPQLATAHISLQCDDFSNVKSKSLKDKSVEDLSTSRDLFIDALRLIETVRPATVMLEQVRGFSTSMEWEVMRIKLRKWGYYVTDNVLNAKSFNGRTGRERHYSVASIFPDFKMPTETILRSSPIWPEIEPYLSGCRDISHTKSLAMGISGGRARLLKPSSLVSPTILKSQDRQTKDSIYIASPNDQYLMPSLELLKFLQGIPEGVNLDSVSAELAVEIVGQSIDWSMHHAISLALHQHIAENIGFHSSVQISNKSCH